MVKPDGIINWQNNPDVIEKDSIVVIPFVLLPEYITEVGDTTEEVPF
jgi:hypothetical protein